MTEQLVKKNGLHDYAENHYRNLMTILRGDGYDAVVKYLRNSPLPTFSEYEMAIPDTNTMLRTQLDEVKGRAPEKLVMLDDIVQTINSIPAEEVLVEKLEELKMISN